MTKLRAGLVGLGSMGRNHLRLLRDMETVELVGVHDPADGVRELVDQDLIVSDLEALIERRLDLCVVATPTDAHESVAVRLAEARVAALIEKPLSRTVESAERIVTAFRDCGVVGAVGHVERFNPALSEMRRRLADGQLGDIYQVATRRQSPFPSRVADVGVVFDLATHDLDLTSWVVQRRFSTVAAQTAYRSGREHEDLVAVVGTLEGGLVSNHLVNWLTPFKERITMVTGEFGCFVADTLAADLTFHDNGSIRSEWDALAVFKGVSEGDSHRYAIAKPEPLRTELGGFIEAVRGVEDAQIVSLEEGLHVVRVAEATLRSARNSTVVEVASVNADEPSGP